LRPDRIRALYIFRQWLALLRTRVAPLVIDGEEALLRVPDLDSLVPVCRVLRQAPALPPSTERLYFSALSDGRRRFSALALSARAGFDSLAIPRLGPLRSFVDRHRKSWLPRFVNLEPSILCRPLSGRADGLPALSAGLPGLIDAARGGPVMALAEPDAGTPDSLATANVQRPSSSPPFFSAHSWKSFEACAGSETAIDSSRNSGTIETLM